MRLRERAMTSEGHDIGGRAPPRGCLTRPHEPTWLTPEDVVDESNPGRARSAVEIITTSLRARARRFVSRSPIAGYGVEDLVQELWVALLDRDARRLRSWDPGRRVPLERFVAVIADRELATLRARSLARRRSAPLVDEATPVHAFMDTWTPESTALTANLLAGWRARIGEQLSVRGRAIFELMLLELDPEQVAAVLDVSRQVVYNWQYQIRAILADERSATSGRIRKRSGAHFSYSTVLSRRG
jgi:DNA-directed RNA polymerase specialized sigma24 family protein